MTTHLLSKGAASSGLPDINKENKKKTHANSLFPRFAVNLTQSRKKIPHKYTRPTTSKRRFDLYFVSIISIKKWRETGGYK